MIEKLGIFAGEVSLADMKIAEKINELVDAVNELQTRAENVQKDTESGRENVQKDIPNTEYVTITADDVFVGGESATEYHGKKIYNLYDCPAYFKEARDIIRDEYGCELLEIHCLQSSTNGKYAKAGNPVADKDGENAWVRVVYLDKNKQKAVSLWAFYYTYGSAPACASYCSSYCGDYVLYYASLRAGLFGSVGVN